MLLPHIPRHPARYLGTRLDETGDLLELGRLTQTGPCTLWLDEGGIHFQRPGEEGPFLLPRRCLIRARIGRRGFRAHVDVWWHGASDDVWVSRFSARPDEGWEKAVEALRAATEQWSKET